MEVLLKRKLKPLAAPIVRQFNSWSGQYDGQNQNKQYSKPYNKNYQ